MDCVVVVADPDFLDVPLIIELDGPVRIVFSVAQVAARRRRVRARLRLPSRREPGVRVALDAVDNVASVVVKIIVLVRKLLEILRFP